MEITLVGHSGCELKVTNLEGKIVVEKKAVNSDYNIRLEAQCNKQEQFHSEKFKSVNIMKRGYDDAGLFYFDMEYISGITLAEYMKDIRLNEIDNLVNILLNPEDAKNDYDENAINIFRKKIIDLEKKLDLKDKEIKLAIELLENYEWKHVIKSQCHGDFTLENMIVRNDQIYLIDFLDSFYESWQIDCAKLLQDIELFWHYRKENVNTNLAMRMLIFKECLVKKILQSENGEEILDTIYHILLLNILRIFPYTKDDETWFYLLKKIGYVKDVINNKDWLYAM